MLFSQIPILKNNFLLKKALKIFRKKTKKGYTFKCQTNQIREIKYQIIITNFYYLII